MKKQPNILLCILIMMLVLNACGNSEYTEETGMETEFDSSESTEETSGTPSESMDDTMEGEVNEMANGVMMTGKYIWFMPTTEQEEKFLKEDIDQIKEIRFEYQSGNDPVSSMTFDFEEQKAYYGDKSYPQKEILLSDAQTNEIREVLRNCAIYEWGTRYEGTYGDTTGSFGWGLYYALEDGRIYTNAGWGVYESIPDNYYILQDGLEAFW